MCPWQKYNNDNRNKKSIFHIFQDQKTWLLSCIVWTILYRTHPTKLPNNKLFRSTSFATASRLVIAKTIEEFLERIAIMGNAVCPGTCLFSFGFGIFMFNIFYGVSEWKAWTADWTAVATHFWKYYFAAKITYVQWLLTIVRICVDILTVQYYCKRTVTQNFLSDMRNVPFVHYLKSTYS